jgi:hypothetical protein
MREGVQLKEVRFWYGNKLRIAPQRRLEVETESGTIACRIERLKRNLRAIDGNGASIMRCNFVISQASNSKTSSNCLFHQKTKKDFLPRSSNSRRSQF